MIPIPRMVQYGNNVGTNTIISNIESHSLQPVTLSSLDRNILDTRPSLYFSASLNAINFKSPSYVQISSTGMPSYYNIQNSTDFYIETYIYLTSTQTMMLCGNLNNNTGTGNYWVTLNNTFQQSSQISLDGYDINNTVQRFRFGLNQTLPLNTWTKIRLQRTSSVLSFYINDVQVGSSLTMANGFRNTSTNSFRIGESSDGVYPLAGCIDSFRFIVNGIL